MTNNAMESPTLASMKTPTVITVSGIVESFAYVLIVGALVGLVAAPLVPTELRLAYEYVLPVGLLLVLAGLLLGQIERYRQAAEAQSKFYLDRCLEALKEVVSLLTDDNNKRNTWLLAARSLRLAERLASKIPSKS